MKEEQKQKCCIKRSGERVPFDSKKILIAIGKANKEEVETNKRLKESEINEIVLNITKKIEKMNRDIGVEEIQDMVEEELMNTNHTIAKLYITYRYQHLMDREQEGLYKKVLGIVDGVNEDVKTENSNKDTKVLNVQRDYIAGETTRECSKKFFMTKEVIEANEKGIIHFHDIDFSPLMRIHNCCLLNIEDMLQNGTVINGIKIEKPHRFLTAMTITTQIILGVSNMQYGGQTVTLTHLAPFVRDTYNLEYNRLKKLYCDELLNKYSNEWKEKFKGNEELFNEFLNIQAEDMAKREAEELTRNEVKAGVQTFNYQLNSMTGGGGQSPFITAFLYLNETQEYKKELAMIIEEVLKQRIQGMKDRNGIWITQAFPKLIYVLDEDNVTEDSEYWYLTKLSAECSAKRMVPDYISAKVMKELKGDIYPCMGCIDGKSIIDYKFNGKTIIESIKDAWDRMSMNFEVKIQSNDKDLYIDTDNVEIYDCKLNKYVKQSRIICNKQEDWFKIKIGEITVDVTDDHPFEVEGKGIVLAKYIEIGDEILTKENGICKVNKIEYYKEEKYSYDVTTESEHFMFDGIYSHNCRSFLTPDRFTDNGIGNIANAQNYQVGKHKYYGRFNQGVVTINLVDVACSSKKDEEKFWKIFEERLELCHRALQIRHNRLKGTKSDVAPLLWQYGVLARLKSGETIDKLLYSGYSTISLGYAGLSECVKYMKDCSHTTTEGKKFALKVMQKMNDKCAEWKQAENIDYSVYGTPIESTTYKFAKCLQKRFGIIEGVTDKNYITNSYHVNVAEKISAFDKLTKEAEFQKLSPGGAISYVECPDLSNNLEVVLQVMKHIYNTILYAELNCKLDVCEQCGFQGAIPLVKDETGKLIFECPQCGNRDENTIHTARRTCGYIGTQGWNQGRLGEFEDRIEHFCL